MLASIHDMSQANSILPGQHEQANGKSPHLKLFGFVSMVSVVALLASALF